MTDNQDEVSTNGPSNDDGRAVPARKFDVWSEGHAATGGGGPAMHWGSGMAHSLTQMCEFVAQCNPTFAAHFDSERMTWWGCKLFDNEADARKAFG